MSSDYGLDNDYYEYEYEHFTTEKKHQRYPEDANSNNGMTFGGAYGLEPSHNTNKYMEEDKIYHMNVAAVPTWYHSSLCIFLSLLGAFGILLNGFVIWCFILRPIIRTPYNLILVNLAVVEFLLAFFGVSMDVLALIQDGWQYGKDLCMAQGALVTTAGFVSMLTLCTLSIGRMASFYNIGPLNGKVTKYYTAMKIVLSIWAYSLALSLPPLAGWGRYVPELSGLGCAPDWHSKNRSTTYVMWILILGFFIPTTITVFASIVTCLKIRELRRSITSNEVRRMSFKRDQRAFRLVLSMSSSYLFCWSPYAILCCVHIFISNSAIGPMMSMVPTFAVKLSVCINPILYIALNAQFRGIFTRYILCYKMPCPRFLKRGPDSDDNQQQKTEGKRVPKDSDEKYQMTSQRHNELETTHAHVHQSMAIKRGSVNTDRISILKNSISHQLIPSGEKRIALRARFSSRKLKLRPWSHCVQVHEPGEDSNQNNPSQFNQSDEDIDKEEDGETDQPFVDAIFAKGSRKSIKNTVRRTKSSPSTNDSGFITDSYGVYSGFVPAESIEDDKPHSMERTSEVSMSKISHCSCCEAEIYERKKDKFARKNSKRVSFKTRKDVATLTDFGNSQENENFGVDRYLAEGECNLAYDSTMIDKEQFEETIYEDSSDICSLCRRAAQYSNEEEVDDNSLSIDSISDSHEKLPLILENESVPNVEDKANKSLSSSSKMSQTRKKIVSKSKSVLF